jgi:hypothetical protein
MYINKRYIVNSNIYSKRSRKRNYSQQRGKSVPFSGNKEDHMEKYGPKAQEKVDKAMHEMKEGKLKSGRSGKKVTNRKQAVAIGLSEARKEGAKVPKK